jgi:hypothetical protein
MRMCPQITSLFLIIVSNICLTLESEKMIQMKVIIQTISVMAQANTDTIEACVKLMNDHNELVNQFHRSRIDPTAEDIMRMNDIVRWLKIMMNRLDHPGGCNSGTS